MATRIPLRDLEQAARDPSGYRTKMSATPSRRFRYGYFNVLRNAIRKFHATRENEAQARDYLEDGLAEFKSDSKKAETEDKFDWYVQEYRFRTPVTVETMGRIAVQLPLRVSSDVSCSGEITRLDIVPTGGYTGWLFRNDNIHGWSSELRMPLIQDALAQELGVGTEDISVGVYGFPERLIREKTYSADEVRAAYSSLDNVLAQLGF